MVKRAEAIIQPPSMTAMVDKNGFPTTAWLQFFAALVALPTPIDTQTLGVTPFVYTASHPGHLLVKGGTVSAITIIRGRTTIITGVTSGFVPLCQDDQVSVAFSVTPSVFFFPFQ